MAQPTLTKAQRRALEALARNRRKVFASWELPLELGIRSATTKALVSRGYLVYARRRLGYVVTDAGRAALADAQRADLLAAKRDGRLAKLLDMAQEDGDDGSV